MEQTPGNDVKRIRLELIKKHCSSSSVGSSSPLECIRREINKYTSVTDTDDIEDPLVWWSKNQNQFPFLSKV